MSIIMDKNGVNVYKYGHYKTEILRGKIYEGVFISSNYSVVD